MQFLYACKESEAFMYPEFAYSRAMQLLLACISFVTAFIYVYFIAFLILQLYGEQATTRWQKSTFALLVGVLLDSAWVYLIYLMGGMRSFSDTVYLLVVTTNPVFALLYYFTGVKVFKLSSVRAIKLMGYVYLYNITVKSLSRLIGSVFFIQEPGRYNYMLDAVYRMTFFVVFMAVFWVTRYFLRRDKRVIEIRDSLYINLKKEIVLYFMKATAIYLFSVAVPLLVTEKIAASVFVFVVFALCLALTIMVDLYRVAKNKADNNLVHIGVLSKEISFPYMRDVAELREKLKENPSLVSILLNRLDYAKRKKVKMNMALQSRLDNFYVDNTDICMIVACLLDNAIEAAASSVHKNVSFAIESKTDSEKLIIINNGTAAPVDTGKILFFGSTVKEQRLSVGGIATVRRIASKYGNCTFNMFYHQNMVTAYFSIRKID